MVLQGRKRAVVGDEVYTYDAFNYLVVSVALPARSHILQATPEKPYLCLRIGVDVSVIIGELLQQLGPEVVSRPTGGRGLYLAEMTTPLSDAVSRLVDLIAHPKDAPALGPLVLREIHYRILTGTLGHRLRELFTESSHTQRIARVISLLKSNYATPVSIDDLAAAVHMSVSGLHHRFKEVTSMSPIQYLKQLRLHEARRLMLTDGLDAAAACYRSRLRQPLPIQPRIPPPVWSTAAAGAREVPQTGLHRIFRLCRTPIRNSVSSVCSALVGESGAPADYTMCVHARDSNPSLSGGSTSG